MSQQFDPDLEDDDAGEEEFLESLGENSVEEVQVDFDRLDAGDEEEFDEREGEDNPYLQSDDVLLDDKEEAALGRNLVPPED